MGLPYRCTRVFRAGYSGSFCQAWSISAGLGYCSSGNRRQRTSSTKTSICWKSQFRILISLQQTLVTQVFCFLFFSTVLLCTMTFSYLASGKSENDSFRWFFRFLSEFLVVKAASHQPIARTAAILVAAIHHLTSSPSRFNCSSAAMANNPGDDVTRFEE